MSFENRLARTDVVIQASGTNITETKLNEKIVADIVTSSSTVKCEQFFRANFASNVVSDSHNTVTVENVQAALEQLESQFSKGATDPTTETETYLDNGDLFYNTNTNQLKVYRNGVWQILLEAEGDMDTLDGSTF